MRLYAQTTTPIPSAARSPEAVKLLRAQSPELGEEVATKGLWHISTDEGPGRWKFYEDSKSVSGDC